MQAYYWLLVPLVCLKYSPQTSSGACIYSGLVTREIATEGQPMTTINLAHASGKMTLVMRNRKTFGLGGLSNPLPWSFAQRPKISKRFNVSVKRALPRCRRSREGHSRDGHRPSRLEEQRSLLHRRLGLPVERLEPIAISLGTIHLLW